MPSQDGTSTSNLSKAKGEGENQILHGRRRRRLGVPCVLLLRQCPRGDVCPAWPLQGAGQGRARAQSPVAGAEGETAKPCKPLE